MIYYSRFLKEREKIILQYNQKWINEVENYFNGDVYINSDEIGIFAIDGKCMNKKIYLNINIKEII
jgi:hypothetical protein